MEGANDLNQFGASGIAAAVSALRDMIRIGRRTSMQVFIGTLLPERVNSPKASHPELVVPTNDEIRSMAAAEGAVLVDLYAAFAGVPDPALISSGDEYEF